MLWTKQYAFLLTLPIFLSTFQPGQGQIPAESTVCTEGTTQELGFPLQINLYTSQSADPQSSSLPSCNLGSTEPTCTSAAHTLSPVTLPLHLKVYITFSVLSQSLPSPLGISSVPGSAWTLTNTSQIPVGALQPSQVRSTYPLGMVSNQFGHGEILEETYSLHSRQYDNLGRSPLRLRKRLCRLPVLRNFRGHRR